MPYSIIQSSIIDLEADILVNASNGIGFMGGIIGRYVKFNGVAESINFTTKGYVEKEARKAAKRNKYLPRYICGYPPGDIFVTGAGSLKANYIIHAVTMRYPGMPSRIKIINKLLPKIIEKAYELNAKSIALPLLGTGTGNISREKVLDLYNNFFHNKYSDLDIVICYISEAAK